MMADSQGSADNAISTRHRSERKQLQARIMQAKNSVKNDKKKKAKLLQEVAEWEVELQKRHERELLEMTPASNDGSVVAEVPAPNDVEACSAPSSSVSATENGACSEEEQMSGQRKSKAQKRREKKEQAEKDRDQRIAESAKSAKDAPRNVERKAIVALLKDRGLRLYEVEADGDCLYNAVSHQLMLRGVEMEVEELRDLAAACILSSPDDFASFLYDPGKDCLMDVDLYCHKIRKTKAWGGHPEIIALTRSLQRKVEIVQSPEPPVSFGEEFNTESLIITYHKHAYRLGEHYNSTLPGNVHENDQLPES